ncbi:MAG: flagellar type III secretion system protein FliR [Selenomonadaceae bacterium]|nr:flagellar type III secretion system protein FliR [Selenomonadaceae bacterium]
MDFYDILQNHIAAFLLVLMRSSGIFLISPFFGSMNVPVQFRAVMALTFTFVLFPVVSNESLIALPSSVIMFLAMIIEELFIGWLIGFVSFVSFTAVNLAGKVMDMQVGFAIVNVMDPTSGQQIPLIGSFLYNLAVMFFLITNGHHMIIAALVESFRAIPVLGMQWSDTLTSLMITITSSIFTTGMKIAMPVTFAILMVNVGMGILARSMPQMNIFVVGIPMHIIVGIFMLSVVTPFYVLFLDVVFDAMYGNISLAIKTLAP